jgi:hypothetical protein
MRIRWGFLLALFLGAFPLWAALGEPEQSVQADREHMAGQVKRTVFENYTLHEITSPDGRKVREYVTPGGTVFAVAWEGRTMPDLSQLLGSYFSLFQQAAASRTRRHGPLVVQAGPLVVESGGHPGAFQGRAYLPHLIPANVAKDVVR